MQALEQIEDRASILKAKLSDIQSELGELEIAAKVLRRLQLESGVSPVNVADSLDELVPDEGDGRDTAKAFAGMTISEIAAHLLREHGNTARHFRGLASEAIELGYEGRRSNDPGSIANSFFAMMNRNLAVFEPTGNGYFRLRESAS